MAKEKKLVESITSRDEDFAQWYTDVVREAKLCDYSGVKGCLNYLPNGYAIWENIQSGLDRRFKETGVENVYLPVLIPEQCSLTGICRKYGISGVPYCAGKRPRDRSCVPENSCGRKDIRSMQHTKRRSSGH